MTENNDAPTTIEEAVNRLLSELRLETKNQVKNSSEEGLINFHFGLGVGIRNNFGLWEKESQLLKNCRQVAGDSTIDPDTASKIIIKALWDRLQEYPPPKLVRGKNQYGD